MPVWIGCPNRNEATVASGLAEVIEFIEKLPRMERQRLLRRLLEMAASPDQFCDFTEDDPSGRPHGVHLFGRYAIRYWDDFADRDLKVVDIAPSDRAS